MILGSMLQFINVNDKHLLNAVTKHRLLHCVFDTNAKIEPVATVNLVHR